MKIEWTNNFPLVCFVDGKWCLELTHGGRVIRAEIGDGRRFAEMVFSRLIAPSIAPRRTDHAPVDFDPH